MAKGKNKDHVSFWFWFFALFVTAVPCIGWIMIIVWAFVGQNESRKNYYKAILAWCLILFVAWFVLMIFGFLPLIHQQFDLWTQEMMKGHAQHPAPHK